MAATSVTGTGPGNSNGGKKPENNGGCCWGKPTSTENSVSKPKKTCYNTLKVGSSTSYKSGNSITAKGC